MYGDSSSSKAGAAVSSSEAATLLDPRGRGAAYKELAGNLRGLEGPPGSVVVTGVSEGVGCSTVCLGLGGALASMGLRTAVLDCNFGRPRLHSMLGEPNFTGLSTALEFEGDPESYGYGYDDGLLVMPTGPIPENPAKSLEDGGLTSLVGSLRERRDVVLLDSPRSREVSDSPMFSRGFEGVLLVVHASLTDREVAREASEELTRSGASLLGVVLNGGVG